MMTQNKSFIEKSVKNLDDSTSNHEHSRNFSFSNSFQVDKPEGGNQKSQNPPKKKVTKVLTNKSENSQSPKEEAKFMNPFNISQSSSDRDSKPDAPFFPTEQTIVKEKTIP